MKILLAGASPSILVKVEVALRLRWSDVHVLAPMDLETALETVEEEDPEVVLLQPSALGWPLEGFIQRLRAFSMVPLVVLEGIVALLRRVQRSEFPADQRISSGGLFLDPSTYEVHLHNQKVGLTFTEFRLLYLLVQNRGAVLSHTTISQQIWGDEVDSSGLAKKYIQRIRRKLGDDPRSPRWIASIHGVGYRFLGASPDGQLAQGAVAS